ncbi:MAG: peptidoglycan editing factor PgeF [Oscillospiraceae bacterium]|nr:peptidoglycan editing factor PgeF [Oscillospiraceae bacterium]MDD4414076.1 peptidoglycan editing factor PgeF [Oscillospiraceae bacterium]
MQLMQSKNLNVNENCGVVYYSFPAFDSIPFVRHGFSTRIGGVSGGIYESMNLSHSRGDKKNAVDENFKRFCNAISVDVNDVVISAQEHHTVIYNATRQDCGRGIMREKGYSDIDGLITNQPGVVLCTQYADCVPLFFADPVQRVVGTSHAGWKGTAARIGRLTVERMCSDYGCKPENIIAGIGPSIGVCCFEVDTPVYEVFQAMEEADSTCFIHKIRDNRVIKYHVDLWEINRRILINAGLAPKQITVTDLCTRCHSDVFWSHRANGSKRGSLAGFISMY